MITKKLPLILASFTTLFCLFGNKVEAKTQKTDADGHVLIEKWAAYNKYVKEDRPQKQETALKDIIRTAMNKELTWDFCDALDKYGNTVINRDWKRYDEVIEKMNELLVTYDDNLVTWTITGSWPLVGIKRPALAEISSDEKLKNRKNEQFYSKNTKLREVVPSYIIETISNDYEYLLWAILSNPRYSSEFAEAKEIALKWFAERYPQTAFVEYIGIEVSSSDNVNDGIEMFDKKYEGKAVGLFAKRDLLLKKYNDLTDSGACSDDFISLRRECVEFEHLRSSFKEEEKLLVRDLTQIQTLIEKMDRQWMKATAMDDKIEFIFKNIESADIKIFTQGENKEKGTLVFKGSVVNEKKSYCAKDTVEVALPALDDGDYAVECRSGEKEFSFIMTRASLSTAMRFSNSGTAVYVADRVTGQPVETVDLTVSLKGVEVWSAKGVSIEGFTTLDEGFVSAVRENATYALKCSSTVADGRLLKSRVFLFNPVQRRAKYEEKEENEGLIARILLDNSAFNPGETVHFKAIVGRSGGKSAARVEEGMELTAELLDPERKTVDSLRLVTNDFGSAAGSFCLGTNGKNGTWTVRISSGGKIIGSARFTVDDFKLANFSISFKPSGEIRFPGDTVRVYGQVKSWSGRSLSSAAVSYTVTKSGRDYDSGIISLDKDGNFEISFKSADSQKKNLKNVYDWYNISVKVVDSTGETFQAEKTVLISQFRLNMNLHNAAAGSIRTADGVATGIPGLIADGRKAEFSFEVKNSDQESVVGEVNWKILKEGRLMREGSAETEELVSEDLSSFGPGKYKIEAEYVIRGEKALYEALLVVAGEEDRALCAGLENYFRILDDKNGIGFQLGASAGPVWAVVQLLGNEGSVLYEKSVYINGEAGKEGSLNRFDFGYEADWPETVRLSVFYFRNGKRYILSHNFSKPEQKVELPLVFSRFIDMAYSGDTCRYEIAAWPGSECAISVFDRSTEFFRPNLWSVIRSVSTSNSFATISSDLGMVSGVGRWHEVGVYDEVIPFQLANYTSMRMGTKGGVPTVTDAMMMKSDAAVSEEVMESADADETFTGETVIRKDFRKVLAWEPFLRPDEEGKVSFSFVAGDKLGTYVVSVFAHDKNLNSKTLRKEMIVRLPVELAVEQPDYLYTTDKYRLMFSVSDMIGEDVDGVVSLHIYDGEDYENSAPLRVLTKPCNVAAGESVGDSFDVDIPSGVDTVGLKLIYRTSAGYSDGVFVSIPVRRPAQTVRETHSAVLLSGMDRATVYNRLRELFVNVPATNAVESSISLDEMLRRAIPETVSADGKDVISVSGVLLAKALSLRLNGLSGNDSGKISGVAGSIETKEEVEELVAEVLSYMNADGGMGWFKGGKSSPVITALVLERFGLMLREGLGGSSMLSEDVISGLVGYIDASYFAEEKYPLWGGGISPEQYLYLRSMFGDIALTADVSPKAMKAFRNTVSAYLLPKEKDGAAGYIMPKARRIATILNFKAEQAIGQESGQRTGVSAFAKAVGFKYNSKARKAVERYMTSLKEYAVEHPSGGYYYPNAVMPFRGLLENEVYAHSLICDLLARYASVHGDDFCREIADGMRLWIMLQKETQQWSSDPAFLLAINSVMKGSTELLETEILILSGETELPFEDVSEAGNGMSIKCTYYRQTGNCAESKAEPAVAVSDAESTKYPGYEILKEGDILNVGDKILAVYELWSAENRSFVKITAPRQACLRPENQLSGYAGYGFGPLRRNGFRTILPAVYREAKSDATCFWYDVFPEEKSVITETLFVTQSGSFTSPAAEVECIYAPHYRANAEHSPTMVTK